MSGRSQLTIAGSWRMARRHCERDCFCYHAPWRIFRRLGLKGNPSWHVGFYQRALAGRNSWRPARALVCATSDETMPALVTRLVPGAHLMVADACATPLRLVEAWAAQTGTPVATIRSRAPRLDHVEGPFNLIITDGLLSLLATPDDRDRLIARLSGLLTDNGLLLYTTRIAGTAGGRLEYDLPGRLLQGLAATTWPGTAREQAQLAIQRWRRSSRPAPYATPDQVGEAFRTAFGTVRVFTRSVPPTLALAAHPAFWTRRGSLCVGIAATHPRSRP